MSTPSSVSASMTTRAKFFWAGLGLVALAQIAAIHALCDEQVSKAQARESLVKSRSMPLSDASSPAALAKTTAAPPQLAAYR